MLISSIRTYSSGKQVPIPGSVLSPPSPFPSLVCSPTGVMPEINPLRPWIVTWCYVAMHSSQSMHAGVCMRAVVSLDGLARGGVSERMQRAVAAFVKLAAYIGLALAAFGVPLAPTVVEFLYGARYAAAGADGPFRVMVVWTHGISVKHSG